MNKNTVFEGVFEQALPGVVVKIFIKLLVELEIYPLLISKLGGDRVITKITPILAHFYNKKKQFFFKIKESAKFFWVNFQNIFTRNDCWLLGHLNCSVNKFPFGNCISPWELLESNERLCSMRKMLSIFI